MAEIKQEVKTFEVDYICDECGKGKMRNAGFVLDSNPPQYPHRCKECGAKKTFYHTYPRTVYERVE